MDDSQALTWDQLVRLEPGLGQLRLDCRFADHRDPHGFDAKAAWEGAGGSPGFKQRLELLVGANAENQDPRILSPQAYELAVAECYRALPPNRPGDGVFDQRESRPG
jgi:hypothetical protein